MHAQPLVQPAEFSQQAHSACLVLAGFGITKYSESRLAQLREALNHPASSWFGHAEADKLAIGRAIVDLIGEPKPDKLPKPPRKRKPVVNADLDFSHIQCDPRLLSLLIKRLPHRPYCSSLDGYIDNCPRRLDLALTKKSIQYNPPGFGSMVVVDVDRRVLPDEWNDAGLPPPTWISFNPANGHAHFVWALEKPVWAGGDNQKPARYFKAVEEAYRAVLRGDEGFARSLTKNPVSVAWHTTSPSNYAIYDLSFLAEFVDLTTIKPRKRIAHKEGLGRNCMLFDTAREWAYCQVCKHADNLSFGAVVQDHLEELNATLTDPLGWGEVLQIGRSITRWVWRHRNELYASFSQAQSARQKLSVKARAARSEPKRLQARSMRADGISHAKIAVELQVSKSTILRWC